MFSFLKRRGPQWFDQMASLNVRSHKILLEQIENYMPYVDKITSREVWLKITVQRLAENLEWRLQHTYINDMNRALGDQYRKRAEELIKRAHRATRTPGMESFSKHAADALAGFYLMAESFLFEDPSPINMFDRGKQKEILRDINSMLEAYDFQRLACTPPQI